MRLGAFAELPVGTDMEKKFICCGSLRKGMTSGRPPHEPWAHVCWRSHSANESFRGKTIEQKRLSSSKCKHPSPKTCRPSTGSCGSVVRAGIRRGGLAVSLLRGAGGPQEPEISPSSLAVCEYSLPAVILLKDLCSRQAAPLPALGVGSAQFALPSQPVRRGQPSPLLPSELYNSCINLGRPHPSLSPKCALKTKRF